MRHLPLFTEPGCFVAVFILLFQTKPGLGQKHDIDSLYQKQTFDTTKITGNVSVSGLIQSGNENRTVASLLSELTIGNKEYEVLPLTSIAYSTKPHATVENEYLENVIIRYHQKKTFYPAMGLSFEKSLLRKIDYRTSFSLTGVCNIVNKNNQTLKLGLGLNYEITHYTSNAFLLPSNEVDDNFNRHLKQAYARLKGRNTFFKSIIILSYDFFYQPNLENFPDYRWTLIGNLDIRMNKLLSFRVSAVDSYEAIVAQSVHKNNFRLTYGLNISFK